MVGTEAERNGIAKDSANMVYAMSTCRVPRLTIIIGGSYGAGNYGMCGRGFWPDFLFAWPTAEVAAMSADICTNILLELRRGSVSEGAASEEELAGIERRTRAMFDEQNDPYYATSRLWDDGLIEPGDTRDVLALCLALCASRPVLPGNHPVYRM
jgi:3-methylcrotonyl-CoA carboxylase beta subunit